MSDRVRRESTRSRSRLGRSRSRERRHVSRRNRTPTPEGRLRREMDAMLARLRVLEAQTADSPRAAGRRSRADARSPRRPASVRSRRVASRSPGRFPSPGRDRSGCGTPPLPPPPVPPPPSEVFAVPPAPGSEPVPSETNAPSASLHSTATDRIVDAIRSINTAQAQSTGKLDSGMRGPYRVVKVLPHGRYELQLLAGSYGKSTQAAAEYMIPWRGEWTPETCAAYFDGADSGDEESTAMMNESPSGGQPLHDDDQQPGPSGMQSMPEPEVIELREAQAAAEDSAASMPMLETDLQS